MFGATVVLVAVLGGGAPAAWAETEPDPSPSLAPATVAITAPAEGAFFPSKSVTLSGTKTAGSSVVVTAGGSTGCNIPMVDPQSTAWTC